MKIIWYDINVKIAGDNMELVFLILYFQPINLLEL